MYYVDIIIRRLLYAIYFFLDKVLINNCLTTSGRVGKCDAQAGCYFTFTAAEVVANIR